MEVIMKRLSVVLFASAVFFGFFSQSFATPVPMEVERQPVRRVAIFSGERMDIEQQEVLAEDAPTATQTAVGGVTTQVATQYSQVVRDATMQNFQAFVAQRAASQG